MTSSKRAGFLYWRIRGLYVILGLMGGVKMDYKLIAIDMDGTLLNSKKEISIRTFQAIQRAKEKGVNVVLATGRLLKSAELFAENLNLNSHILACNGAIIIDGSKNVVYNNPLDLTTVSKIMEIGRKHQVYYHFYDERCFYSNTYVKEIVDYYSGRDQKIDIHIIEDNIDILKILDINIYKFLFIENNTNKLEKLREDIIQLDMISTTKSWINNLEVMDRGVSKGAGLKILCDKLNIPSEDIIAIGDNENDLSMINFAGLGVSMGNGTELVKKEADYITLTNDEDGVAHIIEKFIL